MIYNKSLMDELNSYYDNLRTANRMRVLQIENMLNNDELYVKTLNQLNSLRFEVSKAKFNKKPYDKLAQSALLVESQLQGIMSSYKVTKDMLEIDYNCKECNDSGYIMGQPCKCYLENLQKLALKSLGIEKVNFPTFDLLNYRKLNNISAYERTLKNYSNIFPKFKEQRNILLTGSTGTGKTFLVGCVASQILKKGNSVIFITAFELNKLLIKYHTSTIEEKGVYMDVLCSCDLLIIDDLGSEPIYKNVTCEYLLLLLSSRLTKLSPYIITSNLTQEELLTRYGDRVFSRLNDKKSTVFLTIEGKDLRQIKE